MINQILISSIILSSSVVNVSTPKGSIVRAYQNSELSSFEISQYNQISDTYFNSDVRISSASKNIIIILIVFICNLLIITIGLKISFYI